MKIGVITFHWATNYGAVLQAYALQQFLSDRGNEVDIINYIPRNFKYNFAYFLKHPKQLLRIKSIRKQIIKDKCIDVFRKEMLHLTREVNTEELLEELCSSYDVLISGSDQVLNPSFTLYGENKPTSAYYLQFATNKQIKIGYAVSFGCTEYPNDAAEYAKKWIAKFDKIGVRESHGINILSQFNYLKSVEIVPDPTILYGAKLFDKLQLESSDDTYAYVYMLHNSCIDHLVVENLATKVLYADSDVRQCHIEHWISMIKNANVLITNSYHGMIMAIMNHVPFIAIKMESQNSGMNDRFNTLLSQIGLSDRFCRNVSTEILAGLNKPINWDLVDEKLSAFRYVGINFLNA